MQTKFLEQTTESIISAEEIHASIGALMEDATTAFKNCELEEAEVLIKHVLLISKMNDLIKASSKKILPEKDVFVMSSLFLHDCFKYLNQKPVESLHFVTGPQICNYSVLDRLIDIDMDVQSAVSAKGEENSVRKELIFLSASDHKLQGCFHIHPGRGSGCTAPSATDHKLQETFDRGGYKSLGAIFSRDGYVRFYGSYDFEIQIYGKGVEKKNEKIYRLTEIN